MEFFSPEMIEKLMDYPMLVGVITIVWVFYKINGRLLDIIEKNVDKD